jgi:hypothetical protein
LQPCCRIVVTIDKIQQVYDEGYGQDAIIDLFPNMHCDDILLGGQFGGGIYSVTGRNQFIKAGPLSLLAAASRHGSRYLPLWRVEIWNRSLGKMYCGKGYAVDGRLEIFPSWSRAILLGSVAHIYFLVRAVNTETMMLIMPQKELHQVHSTSLFCSYHCHRLSMRPAIIATRYNEIRALLPSLMSCQGMRRACIHIHEHIRMSFMMRGHNRLSSLTPHSSTWR